MRALAFDALTAMREEMQSFADRGTEEQPPPGLERMLEAIASLDRILERADESMAYNCQQNCSSNRNAVEIELEAMDLIEALSAASVRVLMYSLARLFVEYSASVLRRV